MVVTGVSRADTGVWVTSSAVSPPRRSTFPRRVTERREGVSVARHCCWMLKESFPRRGSSDCSFSALVNSSQRVALDWEPHHHPS